MPENVIYHIWNATISNKNVQGNGKRTEKKIIKIMNGIEVNVKQN